MSETQAYVTQNDHERRRLRIIVESASDDDLLRPMGGGLTVAGVLGHIAFWDARSIWLAERIEAGAELGPAEAEPDNVDWMNDAMRPLIEAIPPREVARLALRMAEDVDARVAALPPEAMWPMNGDSLLNAFRAEHRREHLDEIEAALSAA